MAEPTPSPGLIWLGRLLGLAIVVGALAAGWYVSWIGYYNPRTNDAEVRANLIGIAPHVSGPLVELHVVDNQEVKAGDLLFVIDARPYQAVLANAEAALLLARAELQAMSNSVASAVATVRVKEAELSLAEADLKRYEPLLKDEAIDAETVDTARTRRNTASAEVDAARQELLRQQSLIGQFGTLNARIGAAEADVQAARLNVDYCQVRAPFDARVANLNIAVGQYAQAGQPIFALVNLNQWYVVANYRETFLESLRPGLPADVFLMAYPGQTFRGTIQGVGWAVQSQDGAALGAPAQVKPDLNWVRLAQRIPVRIDLGRPSSEFPFRMGMSAVVTVRSVGDPNRAAGNTNRP